MKYFHTKGGIVKIGKYALGAGYKVYKDPLGGEASNSTGVIRPIDSPATYNLDRNRPNSALLTYDSDTLLYSPISITAQNVPTTSISVKTEPAWDYIPNYEQNSFDVTRFAYEKPSQKTITLEGNYLASITNNQPDLNILNTFYMFDTFVGEFKNIATTPYAYSFSFKDTLHNKELQLGRGMLPQSFNISINGINQVQDATWSAEFIGPYDFADSSSYSMQVASGTQANLGLRAMNTRDFAISCPANIEELAALISFDMSLRIEWEKKATFISYLGDEAPNWRWWGMNNMTGTCDIKMILPLSAPDTSNGSTGRTGKTYAWPVNRVTWTNPTVYALMDTYNSLSLPNFYWQTPSIDFQSENLAVLNYKGVLHNGTVII